MILGFEVEARTGSGALEMLNTALRQLGEHPELIAIRQVLLYPLAHDDGSVVRFEDAAEMFGSAEWEEFERQQFSPEY